MLKAVPRKFVERALGEHTTPPFDDVPPHDSIPESADIGLEIVPPPNMPGPTVERKAFTIEMLDDIAIGDEPAELVQGLLPMGPALGVVFGPPKSLKSFLMNHVALHIAADRPYCGRAVQAGVAVLVTAEGIRGVRRRLIAERRAMDIEGQRVPFALVPTMPNLGAGSADREALERLIRGAVVTTDRPVRIIIIDTMRRAMPGKSENEQKDVSILVDNCEALARAFGCLVILVHHSPRSDDNRGSGSNALDAAADVMWSVIRSGDRGPSTATVVRSKDGEEGDTWTFELRPAQVGIGRDGLPVKTCHVEVTTEPERRTVAAGTEAKPLSAAQQRVYEILLEAVTDAGATGAAGEWAPAGTKAVTRSRAKSFAVAKGWWDESDPTEDRRSKNKWNNLLQDLVGKHVIGLSAEHLWIARNPGQ